MAMRPGASLSPLATAVQHQSITTLVYYHLNPCLPRGGKVLQTTAFCALDRVLSRSSNYYLGMTSAMSIGRCLFGRRWDALEVHTLAVPALMAALHTPLNLEVASNAPTLPYLSVRSIFNHTLMLVDKSKGSIWESQKTYLLKKSL